MVEGGDYSYFKRFDESKVRQVKVKEDYRDLFNRAISSLSLKKLLGNSFKFQDSKKNAGLQLADILANATQRAFNEKLAKNGWADIGSLLIAQDPEPPIHIINLNATLKNKTIKNPFLGVIETFKEKAKSMWVDEK